MIMSVFVTDILIPLFLHSARSTGLFAYGHTSLILENYSYFKNHFVLERTQTAIVPALIPFFSEMGGSVLAGGVML